MIPKTIHYCWFGRKPLPPLAKKCIASWKKYLPDYEIKEWNEDNFNVNIVPYTKEAYIIKKYAFVSDYARFWILYHYGGLYFDTDVEIIKKMDCIIEKGAFMGCELAPNLDRVLYPQIAPGLGLGTMPGLKLYKDILEVYKHKFLLSYSGRIKETIVTIITNIIKRRHPKLNLNTICQTEDLTIYPAEYFCPLTAYTGELKITENTYSIHHYTASWCNKGKKTKIQNIIRRISYILVHIFVKFSSLKKI